MADDSTSNGNKAVVFHVNGDDASQKSGKADIKDSVPLLQKLVAEAVGTYIMIFAGCGAVIVNLNNDRVLTLSGIAIVWGLTVMVLVYSLGHISGAHFNPAVTLALSSTKRFPFKQFGELAGLAVGSTVLLNVLLAGPITGASLNPARSLGPAVVHHEYRALWIYLVSPVLGALAGTWAYNFIRCTKKQCGC